MTPKRQARLWNQILQRELENLWNQVGKEKKKKKRKRMDEIKGKEEEITI